MLAQEIDLAPTRLSCHSRESGKPVALPPMASRKCSHYSALVLLGPVFAGMRAKKREKTRQAGDEFAFAGL
jgi:hypothetical protein